MSSPEAERAAALMRQRMSRTNQQSHMASPPAPQRSHYNPPNAPSMSVPRAGPPPRGAPRSVKNLTGSNRRIPPRGDPLDRYSNIKEKQLADKESSSEANMIVYVNQLIFGILSVVAFSAVFVLPRQLKVFWVLILGLTILILLGMTLYAELMRMSEGGGDNAKYAEWGFVLFFALFMMYTGVMIGVLIFMAWSLYSIANSKTNIARNDRAAMRGKAGDLQGGEEDVYV